VLLGELEEDEKAKLAAEPVADKSESEILAEIAATREALNTLREDSRLPVGPSLWPYCVGEGWMTCDDGRASKTLSADFAFWVLNVLLAGVLIAFGGAVLVECLFPPRPTCRSHSRYARECGAG